MGLNAVFSGATAATSAALAVLLWWASAWGLPAAAQSPAERGDHTVDLPKPDAAVLLSSFELRNIGPFRQGSWITALAAPEVDPAGPLRSHRHTYYVGARNGGVWKTTNNGITFSNVTDSVNIAAVGSLAVAKSDPEVVWVGTGDAEVARSSYSGTGVWRSTDAGASWQHKGLADSHHVARIVVHPTEPDTVWVAVMGHLFSSNHERGVFRTVDGGDSWSRVLDLGPDVGVIDLVIDFDRPNRLWATAYDKVRLPWHFEAGGERSGVYRSDDSGDSWHRLKSGFPAGKIGRIGIDRFRDSGPENPSGPRRRERDILFAIVENLNPRAPTVEEADADRKDGKEPQPRPIGNQVYRSANGGDNWERVSPAGLAVGSK